MNLGRYGPKNVNTEYFKIKLEITNEQIKNNLLSQTTSGIPSNPIFSEWNKSGNLGNNYTNMTDLNISRNKMNPNSKNQNDLFNNSEYQNNSQDIYFITDETLSNIKGSSKTFKFVISYSNLYEPLLISIYDLKSGSNNKDNYFIKNLYFDKNSLFKQFKIINTNNSTLYSDTILRK